VDTAKQAAQRLTSAEEKSNAAQTAAEQAAANNPLAPKPGVAGTKPLPGGTGGGVLGEAKTWLGVPYDYSHMAGETRAAVDCSAFTAAVFAKFGIMLPDSPAGQLGMGTPVSGEPKAGDLVFFSEDGSGVPTHVGIANGDGTLTHASDFTGEVSVTPMKYINGYMGARRLL
jgi:cell wall-associated NlpC family hydrolase